MSALQVIHRDFEGQSVQIHLKADGSMWIEEEELGRLIGYEGERKQIKKRMRKHWSRHADELLPFKGTVMSGGCPHSGHPFGGDNLSPPSGGGANRSTPGGAQRVRAWRKEAVYLFSMWARTEVAKRFRAWAVQTFDQIDRGEVVVLSRAQFAALEEEKLNFAQQAVQTALAPVMEKLSLIERNQEEDRKERQLQASRAAKTLAARRKEKLREAEADNALREIQGHVKPGHALGDHAGQFYVFPAITRGQLEDMLATQGLRLVAAKGGAQ